MSALKRLLESQIEIPEDSILRSQATCDLRQFCDLRVESLNLYLFKLVGLVKTGLALNLRLDLVSLIVRGGKETN